MIHSEQSTYGRLLLGALLLCLAHDGVVAAVEKNGDRPAKDVAVEDQQLSEGRFGHALNAAKGGYVAPANERYGRWPLTVEFWVQTSGDRGEHVLLSHEAKNSGTHWELTLRRGDGMLALTAAGMEPPEVATDVSLADGKWRHVTMVLETTRARLYIDGRLAADQPLQRRSQPSQPSGLGVGVRIEDRRPSAVLIDDVRISSAAREVLTAPEQALIQDEQSISLWSFDESQEAYLARWTPGGETNQRGLPYPHRIAEYEFETDANWVDGRWQETDKGPFLTHSTQIPGKQVGPKNVTVFLDREKTAAVMFDLERCAAVAGFTRAELTIDPLRFGLLRKPKLSGDLQFYLPSAKAWRVATGRAPQELTPLDKQALNYRGLHLHQEKTLLTYRVLGGEGREHASLERGAIDVVARHLEFEDLDRAAFLTVAETPAPPTLRRLGDISLAACEQEGVTHAVALVAAPPQTKLIVRGNDVLLPLPAGGSWKGKLLHWSGPTQDMEKFVQLADTSPPSMELATLQTPAAGRWGPPLTTRGEVGHDAEAPYVIDTITLPYENPYRALFFVSALDFFSNGDAALCTAHGDVWRVSGLDASLQRIVWRRFATGLYQPLGLKVVDDKAIVLGRDQLTRLHDLNDDGEADFYESFNNDLAIVGADHAYAMRLETDPAGNFYFVKSGSYEPHGSALLKVSRDGSSLSVVARGFRHPYGIGVGPRGEVTVADNEGNWVPSSKIDLIREAGFYGFLGGAAQAPENLRADRPLCFLPKVADNSCGGQTWVTSDRWGNYHRGEMLHFSWGRCTLHAVLRQEVGDMWQAATVRFPDLTFLSGAGEGAFHPLDGQLYVVGLDGWQTGAVQDGCFQRVRYTGRPVYMPTAFQTHENGVKIAFTQPLANSAARVENFRAEQWNYRWGGAYGSFHYSAKDSSVIGHDVLPVASVTLLPDENAVFLEIPGLKPVDQLHMHTDLLSQDGKPLRFDLYSTINALAPPMNLTR